VDAKKTPSSREYQLLAVLVRNEWVNGKGAELNGRAIAKAYEQEVDDRIPSGTVYTLLAAMEELDWVKSREDIFEGRRTRWYWLTKRGIDAVERWRQRASVLLQLTDPAAAKGAKAPRPAKTRAGG
jgi:DNA-binding PadR family transcriptional regulator